MLFCDVVCTYWRLCHGTTSRETNLLTHLGVVAPRFIYVHSHPSCKIATGEDLGEKRQLWPIEHRMETTFNSSLGQPLKGHSHDKAYTCSNPEGNPQ